MKNQRKIILAVLLCFFPFLVGQWEGGGGGAGGLTGGTVVDGRYCTGTAAAGVIDCDTVSAGAGDIKADGTVPMTANWDIGAYWLRALQFWSDIPTGTAPLIVASETMVDNLNADLLDGEEAAAFEDADAAITKSDEAETLTEDWVNTDHPWADNEVADDITIDEAATATALAADPADCAANQFADEIAASGDLTCKAIVDADVPDDITIDLSTAATGLGANGANCGAGNYPLGVDEFGAVESCTAAAGTAWGDPVNAHILPTGADNTYDLGSEAASFKDGHFDGTLKVGVAEIARSAEPQWNYGDSDCTDPDDNVRPYVNCTGTGTGAEYCDYTVAQQINGVLTDRVFYDADGNIVFYGPVTREFATVEESADAATLTKEESKDTLVTNRGWDGNDDQTITMAEADTSAGKGLKFKFMAVIASGGAADTYFDTEGATTKIYLDGVAGADGDRINTNEIAVGEGIICHTFTIDGSTYDWACDSINGAWINTGS